MDRQHDNPTPAWDDDRGDALGPASEQGGVLRTNEETEAEAHGAAFEMARLDAALGFGDDEIDQDFYDDDDFEEDDEDDDFEEDDDDDFEEDDEDDEMAAISDLGAADNGPMEMLAGEPWYASFPPDPELDAVFYQATWPPANPGG